MLDRISIEGKNKKMVIKILIQIFFECTKCSAFLSFYGEHFLFYFELIGTFFVFRYSCGFCKAFSV